MTPFKRPQSDEINAPVDITQNFERYKPGYPGLSKEMIEKGPNLLDDVPPGEGT